MSRDRVSSEEEGEVTLEARGGEERTKTAFSIEAIMQSDSTSQEAKDRILRLAKARILQCVSSLSSRREMSPRSENEDDGEEEPSLGGSEPDSFKVSKQVERSGALASVECHLETAELWNKFHELGTEMIITKTGRRMFPTVRCSFSGLNPNAHYSVVLDIVPSDNKRYRYAYHRSSWLVAGKADPPPPHRFYPHPDGPFFGEQLCRRQIVSFEKVKLTNNELDQTGQIILNSMHKFQPRIHLVLTRKSNKNLVDFTKEEHKTFSFPETSFTAVTAYQNQLITKLKIDSNPFAKGFRDSSRLAEFERENFDHFFDRSIHLRSMSPSRPEQQPLPGPPSQSDDCQKVLPRQCHPYLNAPVSSTRPDHAGLPMMPIYALQALRQQQHHGGPQAPLPPPVHFWTQWAQLQQHLQSTLLLQIRERALILHQQKAKEEEGTTTTTKRRFAPYEIPKSPASSNH